MTGSNAHFESVIRDVDASNADDPRGIMVDGVERPYEVVYSERMSARLGAIYPDAGELLRIAARAQHIRRWDIPRNRYPEGRNGYNDWRKACRKHHAALIAGIMQRRGYDAAASGRVGMMIMKEQLKKDWESQALENVVDVVFIEHYFDEFLSKHASYDDAKLVDIVGKTLRKMSPKGRAAALQLRLPERTMLLIEKALTREADTLAKQAKLAID
jgi:hypothetical protein